MLAGPAAFCDAFKGPCVDHQPLGNFSGLFECRTASARQYCVPCMGTACQSS